MYNNFNDIQYIACPYCGGTEMIETKQDGYGGIYPVDNIWRGAALHHTICRRCGTVVRSYVVNPEKLLKRSDRR